MAYVLGIFISLLMWSFGLIWLVFALATVLYSSPFPFNMGWWGFTFPLGVYAANSMELGIELDLMFFKVFGTVGISLTPDLIFAKLLTSLWVLDSERRGAVALGSCWVTYCDRSLAREFVLRPLSSKPDFQRGRAGSG